MTLLNRKRVVQSLCANGAIAMAKYAIKCGGSFPSRRLACRPAAATASSTASR